MSISADAAGPERAVTTVTTRVGLRGTSCRVRFSGGAANDKKEPDQKAEQLRWSNIATCRIHENTGTVVSHSVTQSARLSVNFQQNNRQELECEESLQATELRWHLQSSRRSQRDDILKTNRAITMPRQ